MKAFGALPGSDPAVQPDTIPAAASFSLLGRVAASLWFVVLAILFAQGLTATIRVLPSVSDNFTLWAAVISRCCTLVFYATLGGLILMRPRPLARQDGIVPLIVSFCGTYGVWLAPFLLRPFLLKPGEISAALQIAASAVTLFGSLSIILVLLRVGRSFGPYRLVRHPLYVAKEIALVGFLMQYDWYAALAFLILHMGCQIRRMMYEESLLRAVFPDYEAYARRTARLIPGIW